ncbi:MAG: ribosome small subunit-dependent GTPase A [Atopobiaceae bacterium]|nr:ribosome small subunit-dependent GTPase A [Atopobiaceae bacterium]
MAKRSSKRTARAERAGGVGKTLPALSSLGDLPGFGELTPSAAQLAAFEGACARARAAAPEDVAGGLVLGCVVRLDRGYPAIVCEGELFRAEFATRLTKGSFSRVAVGDWVCARRPGTHEMGIIEEILPRESDIARWKGGARGERQTLAANVDVVIVVQALGPEVIDCARVARSAVVARDCGAQVAVVLTKADRATDEVLAADVAAIHDVVGADVRVVVTSSEHGHGVDDVRVLVPEGTIAIVLGESGAGKSTLLNALLGRDVLETGAVRQADDMGRHTTVARRMVSLPGGGIIVDEPGLRSLPLVGHERGLALVFPEISEQATTCRFRDCTHTHEPGCSVREGLDDGLYSRARLDAYLALAAEMRASAGTLDPDVVI